MTFQESIPEWISPKYAKKIVGYEKQNFYKTLKKVNPDGSLVIPHQILDIPGRPIMYNVHAPSLIPFMEEDVARMQIEANYWLKRIKHQKDSILRLKRVFGNAGS